MEKEQLQINIDALDDAVIFWADDKNMSINSPCKELLGNAEEWSNELKQEVENFVQQREVSREVRVKEHKWQFTKIIDVEKGTLIKVSVGIETSFDRALYKRLLGDFLYLSHENIFYWELDEPLDLSISFKEKLAHLNKHLVLRNIVKTVSGYLAGIDQEKLIGQKASALFDLSSKEMIDAFSTFFKDGLFIQNCQIPVISLLNKEVKTFSLSAKGYAEDGYLKSVLFASHNITDELALQKQIVEKNTEWDLFSKTVPGGLFEYCVYPDGSAKVVNMTAKAYEVMGVDSVSVEDALDHYISQIHPDDLENYLASIQKSVAEVSNWTHKHRLRQKDGSFKWVRGISSPRKTDDGIIHFYGIIIDINEEEQTSAQLALSNQKYKLATETARLGIWELDLKTNKVQWDNELYQLYQLDEKIEIDYSFWINSIHPDDKAHVQKKLEEATTGEADYDITYRVLIKNEVHYHKVRAIFMKDSSGLAHSVLGVTWDVTEMMNYQKEVEQLAIKYKLATQTARMGIWSLDIKTGEVVWDDALYEILDFPIGSVSKVSDWAPRVHKDDMQTLEKHLIQAINGEREYDETFRYLISDNEYGYNKTKGIVLKNDKGEPESMLGVAWDVSEEVRYQKQLEDLNLKHSLAIGNQRVAIWDYNPKTEMLYTDQGFIDLYGLSVAAGEPVHVSEILKVIDPRDRDGVFSSFMEALNSKASEFSSEYTIHNPKDNRTKHIEIVCSPQLNGDGEVERMIGLSFDLTERKQKENEISKLLETGEKLFSVIAHDLSGPISNLLGVTSLLADNLDNLSKKEVSDFIKMIRQSSASASGLLKNLLDWSRNISNRIPFQPIKIDLVENIEQAISFYSLTADKKDIAIEVDLQPETAVIFADHAMINTVIRNLLANAIKFTPMGGKVSLTLNEYQGAYELKIADTGLGMTSEQIAAIRSKEGKLQRPGTNKEKGTGLGLIIVQDFLSRHKLSLDIQSEVDQGTTFFVHFPKVG